MRIVALERRPRRRLLCAVLEDGRTIEISPETAVAFAITPGVELTTARLAELTRAEARHKANAAALRMLARTALSDAELQRRLARRGVPPDIVAEVAARMRGAGLIDDAAFAAAYAERRDRSSPRSRALIGAELRARGVARDTAAGATAALDDLDAAVRAGSRRARTLHTLAHADFRRRLGEFLLRRGFSFETADEAITLIWRRLREAATEP